MKMILIIRNFVFGLSALTLAGCGFQPMYADTSHAALLRSVNIDVSGQERHFQLLSEALRDEFGSRLGDDRYRLTADIQTNTSGLGVGADDIATRMALGMTVTFMLFDARTGEMLINDYVRSEASFDVPIQPYAAESARRDAEERATRDAAQRISILLSRYFSRNDGS